MTTTLAELLAGEDMEGGENFCDSVYNFLKNQGKDINLFTNSGFGVWSQSDGNKGLATLPFDSGSVAPVVGETMTGATSGAVGKVAYYEVTGGTWGGANAAGNITLGAVAGTFQDNENVDGSVGGANMLTVNGDSAIGIENDPMNNDSTGAWTDDGAGITLAFVAAEYTVTTNAGNQRAWIANAALEAGKQYKIELDIKDGTAAGADIEGYFDDGAAQYGRIRTTAAGWASVSWTFTCATATAAGKVGFRIPTSLAASNIEIRRFSCYEITPCCTAADSAAFDGWEKDTTIDIYREYHGTNTFPGSFYSLCCVPGAAGDFVIFDSFNTRSEFLQQFEERPLTVGVWAKTATASHFRWVINDGDAHLSDYHTGSGNWEWIEFTVEIKTAPTAMYIYFTFDAAPAVDGDTIVYFSQPMAVFGWSLGQGMYQPRLQEIIWLENLVPSNRLNNLQAQSDIATTTMNLEADTDAMLPKGAKAIFISVKLNDSGSAGDVTAPRLYLRADGTADFMFHAVGAGLANDAHFYGNTWQACNSGGDYDYYYDATGANTLDIDEFSYHAIQVN